jgi:hypothetical protein
MLGEIHPVEDFCYMDNTDVGAEVCSNNIYGLLKRVCSADIAPITEVHMDPVVLEISENWKSISVAKVDNVHVSGNVTSEGSDSVENMAKLSKLPDYLVDLYNRSCTNLKDESLQENLAEVFVKHQQAFAKNKDDLGTCSFVKHRINTKDATPVHQPLRRTPKGEEERRKRI